MGNNICGGNTQTASHFRIASDSKDHKKESHRIYKKPTTRNTKHTRLQSYSSFRGLGSHPNPLIAGVMVPASERTWVIGWGAYALLRCCNILRWRRRCRSRRKRRCHRLRRPRNQPASLLGTIAEAQEDIWVAHVAAVVEID